MCEVCATYNETFQANVNVDPTRTTSLRNAFVREMNKEFNALIRIIQQAIIEDDVFGLNPIINQELSTPGPRAFNFNTNEEKVSAFMEWLRRQEDAGLLRTETVIRNGGTAEQAITDKYITDSYRRGVLRADTELRKAGYDIPSLTAEQREASNLLATPVHTERVQYLYTRTFSELKGITSQMDTQISKVLAQALVDGDSPRTIAAKLTQTINGLGNYDLTDSLGRYIPAKRRAEIMARTEIIRAHHQATIEEYKRWRVQGVRVQAEFTTAGDNRVCEECSGMSGNVYTLEQSMNIIPVHPQCRCIMLPIRANESINVN